jgi:hypothetical protein
MNQSPFAPPQPFAAQTGFTPQPAFAPQPVFAQGFGPGPGVPNPPQGFGSGPGMPGQPFPPFPPFPPAQGSSSKKPLFIGLGVAGAVVVLLIILWATGVFGGGSRWIEGRWCGGGVQMTFTSSGTVTTSSNPAQPSTYTLSGTTLTITAPQGQSGTFTVSQINSNTMSFGAPGSPGAAQLTRC